MRSAGRAGRSGARISPNSTPPRWRGRATLGWPVAVWTVNEPGDIEAMIDLRVDAIVTDYTFTCRLVRPRGTREGSARGPREKAEKPAPDIRQPRLQRIILSL